ncbi:DHA2 family efflux MFS transporter permease subunit [Paenibacillus sp. N1-5-1-14]|uniref:DHA2 family efflux MFS transporter permease subunit n=1 Tax=Paenibacillus radicibacter TaxID=2972488 RepID=UPI00215904F5|nr:DHA2 family efflux MFS transporter permease subunit [Paenibacillus radicibacter]MCR8641632.1 DHA2 family efflux MFS transporter permease subunit [Paenibacillus radicibacter]
MNTRSSGLILFAIALGLFMSALDNTITSAAISHIIQDLSGFERVSWVFTSYMLASTSTILIFGKMSDIFGRKLMYLIGITFFLIGSALCGTATSMDQLILYRAIQGIGAGAIFPISFTIIYSTFADPKQASKVAGIMAAVFGLSSVAGPQIGTFISEHWGWTWCFYVNVPLGILSFFIVLFRLKESRSTTKPKIDYLGTFLLIVTTLSIMLGLEFGGKDYAWTSPQIIGLFALGLVGLCLFILVERRVEEPVLPFAIYRSRMVISTTIACLCQGVIMFSAITYLPMFTVAVMGHENSNSTLTPMMLSLIIGAIAFGFLQSKFSFRSLMSFTMISGIVAASLLTSIGYDTTSGYMIFLMVLLGFGAIGPLMSVAQNAVAVSVDAKYLGVTSSVVGFWRNFGGILGASMMATIVNNNLKDTIASGAESLHIPLDKIDTLANPQLLIHAGSTPLPPAVHDFLRDALGSAINHGFILAICFCSIGLIASLLAGPGSLPSQKQETSSEGQSVQPQNA